MGVDVKIGTLGFVILFVIAIFLAIVFGAEVGIRMGRQQMAATCNAMENADCDYRCASDGCMCIKEGNS